jgi:hypothetical protein
MTDGLENQTSTGQRPTFLTVLCILSFIAAGIGIITMLLASAVKGVAENVGVNNELSNAISENAEASKAMEAASTVFSWPYMILSIVLIFAGLFGVIKMWKLQKSGFMIYTVTAVAGLIAPLLFGLPFSVFSLIISAGFVGMYYLNLKHMS